MKDKLILEAFYPDPPERVWKALTGSGALSRWLMPAQFEPKIGFRFQFEGLNRGKTANVKGVVLEAESPHRLAYTWEDGDDDAPGVVAWTLRPQDGGTHLTLEHLPTASPQPYVMIEASLNWSYALNRSLPSVLRLLQSQERYPRVPIVYVTEDPETDQEPKRRAGFRKEKASCPS